MSDQLKGIRPLLNGDARSRIFGQNPPTDADWKFWDPLRTSLLYTAVSLSTAVFFGTYRDSKPLVSHNTNSVGNDDCVCVWLVAGAYKSACVSWLCCGCACEWSRGAAVWRHRAYTTHHHPPGAVYVASCFNSCLMRLRIAYGGIYYLI